MVALSQNCHKLEIVITIPIVLLLLLHAVCIHMYLSLVLLKIWVSDTLFPVDVSPSMVSIVDVCPATYNAQPNHSIWSP